jgi:hypothetical protein
LNNLAQVLIKRGKFLEADGVYRRASVIEDAMTTDCCDFGAGGPIVVALRPYGQFHSTLQNCALEDMGVQARSDTRTESAMALPQDLELSNSDSPYRRSIQ